VAIHDITESHDFIKLAVGRMLSIPPSGVYLWVRWFSIVSILIFLSRVDNAKVRAQYRLLVGYYMPITKLGR
jgi:hypothetical protein